jgi:hypothetical protein
VLHTQLHVIRGTNGQSLGIFQKSLWKVGEHRKGMYFTYSSYRQAMDRPALSSRIAPQT